MFRKFIENFKARVRTGCAPTKPYNERTCEFERLISQRQHKEHETPSARNEANCASRLCSLTAHIMCGRTNAKDAVLHWHWRGQEEYLDWKNHHPGRSETEVEPEAKAS